MQFLPIEAEEIMDYPDGFKCYSSTFIRDFGPWKAGEICDVLTFDMVDGVVYEHDGPTLLRKHKLVLDCVSTQMVEGVDPDDQ